MRQAPQHYVVGFYFNSEVHERVLLIEKQRPKWQKGRLNGVGGHVESDETPRMAMNREFREETGVGVGLERWEKFCELSGTMDGEDFIVHFFTATRQEDDVDDRQMTDEKLWWVDFMDADDDDETPEMLPNLRWLLPMSAPATKHDWPYMIREKGA